MTQDDIDQREWARPENWHAGPVGVYCSRRDSRVWVPRRHPALGWTVNVGRKAGVAWTAFFAGGVLLVLLLAALGL